MDLAKGSSCQSRSVLREPHPREAQIWTGPGQKRVAPPRCTGLQAAGGTQVAEGSRRRAAAAQVGGSPAGGGVEAGEAPSPVLTRLRHSSPESWNYNVVSKGSEMFAASVGNVDWLRFCLNRGRERKEIAVDSKGFSAIHFAAQRNKLPSLQVLVDEYKFPVDQPTNSGQTALHLVIQKNKRSDILPCVDYLLRKGADINLQADHGCTPLHLAAQNGQLGCMKTLVKSGANVHAQDALGYKPIDYCKLWNHRDCARFLKDAMWKQDKKNFAQEMGKLKTLKRKLAILERRYLIEFQKKQRNLRDAHFRTWLQGKLPAQTPASVGPKQAGGIRPWSAFIFKTLGPQLSKTLYAYPSVEVQLQSLPSPAASPKPVYKQTTVRRPKVWDLSTNPDMPPATKIGHPQGIRLGVHPDPCKEHDFCRFLKVSPNSLGGACLRTVDDHEVTPVPHLPFEVMVQTLYPGLKSYRMKVPQGFCPVDILRVPQKRHLGDTCTREMAMSLRETFDEPFLATLEACRTPVVPLAKEFLR
ncbi:ankyrin repeat domain-containing protein 53 [Psammomys obesus]|uniref:ankyrin repeat domain-containing protein 53 n=1 Tax=Psammomys obesus TaxID=48139 RepID=UPI002452989E|nr:ankyrin repeat domain-containing protein 53 [Psammomys obesus]